MVRAHVFPFEMEIFLQMVMGMGWILTYLVLIYKGFKDKSCGMPFAALCGNATWEFIYSFLFPLDYGQVYINSIWFGLDLIIFYQFIKYSKSELPKPLSEQLFVPTAVVTLVLSFGIHYTMKLEFSEFGTAISAYGLNLMMSILFILMLFRRNHLKGQSIYIAIFKLVGTIGASFLCYSLYPTSTLLMFFYISTFFFDVVYLILLDQKRKDLRVFVR
ncbi:hypothetical protein [Ammoniphilus resinae]|uniref:Uncharacterized protein n=1 Tax=Ammoniphilus resinae TaxID=861532 RepID=A0ABS4GLE1_9BACL|nr:hypothetical protein [Ammoniphilus resinae]MBP1931054.1 hypothetical protein [Ammoniphilus resinae]